MNDFALARDRMIIEQLEARGIHDPRVLEAFRRVARERFVDPERIGEAYADKPLPIVEGQIISQPYIVALMLQSAEISPSDRVLEIGAGSGYAAALLAHLAQRIWTIERHARLARFAGARIAELGLSNVTVLRGDGTPGWPHAAPFDVIIVSAGAPTVSATLKQQLAIGGRLVIPIGPTERSQRLLKIVRLDKSEFAEEDLGAVSFVPLQGEHGFPTS